MLDAGMSKFTQTLVLDEQNILWGKSDLTSSERNILLQISDPFQKEGGMGPIEDAFDATELEAYMVAAAPFQGPKI
jgi:hypothetical protein